jgi:demethoxyubiquinone hydroxylase (CLK1/Coq7/Cat5 family)
MEQATTNPVKHLNSFLQGELSAVETYQRAIEKLDRSQYRGILENCWRSHVRRAELLEGEVRRLGGQPAQSSGPWGALSRLIGGGAAILGEKTAIAALEQGEDNRRDEYRRDLGRLPDDIRHFVESTVLPEQAITHAAVSALKKSLV